MGDMSVLPVPPDGCGGCADRDMVIAAQAAQIEAQAAEVRDLRERLERLERLVTSNSGFSELRVRDGFGGLAASCVRRRA
jgi:hypothetical protein